jgi:hypothetical protein
MLVEAPWNPRVIGEGAKQRLRAAIRDHGLVETLVWNERTGHVVSGHQRLAILDGLERSRNYEVTVAVVDVDEAEEKRLNVILNNPSIQGDWNVEALAALSLEHGLTFASMGFSEADVDFLFEGDSRFSKLFHDTAEVKEAKEQLKQMKDGRRMKDVKRGIKEQLARDDEAHFFFTVVCENEASKRALLRKIGVPGAEEFVDGDLLEERLKDEKAGDGGKEGTIAGDAGRDADGIVEGRDCGAAGAGKEEGDEGAV